MKLKSSQLKANARGHMTGKYSVPILAYMISDMVRTTVFLIATSLGDPYSETGILILLGISVIFSAIMTIFTVGQNKIHLHLARNPQFPVISDIWYGFKGHADNIIITFFQIFIRRFAYALPLGFALVLYNIMPGSYSAIVLVLAFIFSITMIIKLQLDYGLVYFLIIDHPEETPKQLLAHSKELMQGNRKGLFLLYLSFIGMLLLIPLSFGFATFWVMPYIRMTLTEFYINLTTEPFGENVSVDAENTEATIIEENTN